MRLLTFSRRTTWEILRDPMNLGFGLGFPLVLLLLMTMIQKSISAKAELELFALNKLTPGMSVFGMSFLTLFSATLLSKDRSGAFLQRLYTTPMTSLDYILGYTLPLLPMALGQALILYGAAVLLGLELTIGVLWCVLLSVPVSLFFVALGLLLGTVLNDKQVGGICGAALTNLTVWLSGTFFDLDAVGGSFRAVAYALPFVHGVELEKAVLAGQWSSAVPHLLWVLAYGLVATVLAVWVFTWKKRNN
jgi:ABC-2 type transport system permease protein